MEEKEQEVKYHQNGAHPATEPASKRARLQATISLTPTPVSRSAADQNGEKSVGQQRGPSRQKIHAGDGVQPHEADKTHHTSNVIMGTSAGAFYQRSRQRGSASALNLDAEKQLQQLMPGEALRAWLEENQTAAQEEPLIEDVHEEAPHKPSAAELAADAACDRLLSLLSGLTAARDSIAQATEGALVTAAAGAAPRAVRMILDAVNGAPRPRERLPFLYLLDSALKAEARNHQNAEATNSRDVPPPSFPRAVGAALLPLVTALLGDPSVTSKMEKVLRIWHRDGLVASVLVDSALEVITAGAETQRNGENEEEQPVSQALYTEGEAFELLRSVPMNAVLTLNYTMPGGKKQIVRPPNDSLSSDIRPDDWGTAAPLTFHVPDSPSGMMPTETRQKAFDANGFSGGSFSSDGIGELKDVSPWRRQWVELEEKTERLLSARRQAPNPAAMNHLDEFDLGLLKGVMGAVSTTKGNQHVGMQTAAAPPPPLESPPPLPGMLRQAISSLEYTELLESFIRF